MQEEQESGNYLNTSMFDEGSDSNDGI